MFSVLQDRSTGKGSTAHVNTFPMIRWVLRRMHDGGWTLLPNDTEPGFSFLPDSETRDIAISSLVPGSYTETHFDGVQLPGLMNAHCVIAKGVGGLHGKRAQSAVFSSQWCEGATAISQIRLLCNTTKGSGEVPFRCVHSAVSSMWTGLSAWLAHPLREKIAKSCRPISYFAPPASNVALLFKYTWRRSTCIASGCRGTSLCSCWRQLKFLRLRELGTFVGHTVM